jgi:hypothetical protein
MMDLEDAGDRIGQLLTMPLRNSIGVQSSTRAPFEHHISDTTSSSTAETQKATVESCRRYIRPCAKGATKTAGSGTPLDHDDRR